MNNLENLIDMLLQQAIAAGAENADAIVAQGQTHSVAVRLGKTEAIERSEDHDIGLRVFINGRNASISTTQINEKNIKNLAQRAVSMAKAAPEDPYAFIAPKELLAKTIPNLDINDTTSLTTEQLKNIALEAEDTARTTPGITNSEGGEAGHEQDNIIMATTNGFAQKYQSSSFGISAAVIAEKNGSMESDYDYTAAVYYNDLKNPAEIGQNAAKRTLEKLGATPPPTGTYPVIYDTRVARSIAAHIAAAINGSAIARGTSFLKDKMEKNIAAKSITMIDDPLRPRGLASAPFDGEGLPRQKRTLVENGTLKGWLLDLAAAKKLGLKPTANAGRGIGSPPYPSTSNWIMMGGDITRDELIAETHEGFLVTELIGSSVNLITGDYSRGAAGFWIKNGKITHPITEATIAGNLNDMLMKITLADDLDLTKATAAPTLRIDGMTVAGAA